jgi:hypothetical protein
MKLSDFTKTLSPLEIAALVIFIVYIVFPFKTPLFLAGVVNTPIGLLSALILTLYLFFYTNPILGVVFIFVAYELIRRTSLVKVAASDNYMVRSSPSEAERSIEMKQMNPTHKVTLEEDVVAKMAPATVFQHVESSTGYKPVIGKTSGSLYR